MMDIQLTACPPMAELETAWRGLEAEADASFFTSWTWIGSWLASQPAAAQPQMLRARTAGGEVTGLALLGQCTRRRHGVISSQGLFVNASGDAVADAIAIEYNGLLTRTQDAAPTQQAMLEHLVRRVPGWDELYLPGIVTAPQGSTQALGTRWQTEHKPVYLVDLAPVRAKGGDYPGLLGQQPRYQIRKSEKACLKIGPIRLSQAATLDEALEYLDALKALHQPYWVARGEPGAFASGFANRFHRELLTRAFPRGEVQLLRVTVGEQVLGYLYNFLHRGHVYNYQTGIDYDLLQGSVSPGLVCHARAIAHNAAAGMDVYDFMAGDQRYKRSMSTRSLDMQWAVLQRDKLKFRAEDALRRLKRQWVARRAATSPAPTPAPEAA